MTGRHFRIFTLRQNGEMEELPVLGRSPLWTVKRLFWPIPVNSNC